MSKKKYAHLAVGLILALLVLFAVPEGNGLTAVGVRTLAVIAMTVYYWIFVGTDWVSLLAICLFAIAGTMPMKELIGKGLGGHFVAPPTAVRNIAVQQQFRATCRLVSKLPKLLRHGHSSCCPPGGLACGFVISSTSRLRLASITRWRILRL